MPPGNRASLVVHVARSGYMSEQCCGRAARIGREACCLSVRVCVCFFLRFFVMFSPACCCWLFAFCLRVFFFFFFFLLRACCFLLFVSGFLPSACVFCLWLSGCCFLFLAFCFCFLFLLLAVVILDHVILFLHCSSCLMFFDIFHRFSSHAPRFMQRLWNPRRAARQPEVARRGFAWHAFLVPH